MSREKRKWVHPDAIQYGDRGKDGKYQYYTRSWEHITLIFEDYEVVRSFNSQTTDGYNKNEEFDRIAAKLKAEGWEQLTKDERKKVENAPLDEVEDAKDSDGIVLQGWANLDDTAVCVFTVEDDPTRPNKVSNEDYGSAFRRLKVSISSSPQDKPGVLWIWGEDIRKIDRRNRDSDMPKDEDSLCASFHMHIDKMKVLVREIAELHAKPTLVLHGKALLFWDEFDSWVYEPGDFRQIHMIHGHKPPVVLESLAFKVLSLNQPDQGVAGTHDAANVR